MLTNLYINIGNTNTLFGFSLTNNINELRTHKISTEQLKNSDYSEVLDQYIKSLTDESIEINKIYISSVVPSINESIEQYFSSIGKEIHFISYQDFPHIDLSNLYNPYQLGADLLAQTNYVNSFVEEAIVVSAGTVCAIYHIKNSKFSGCIILDGISQSMKNITRNTNIQNIELSHVEQLLGFNSNEAISIGLINNVENIVKKLQKELNTDCPIICSGGDSHYFSTNKWWFIDNLEIIGLFILDQNQNKE